jgi:hypothetical protein
VPDRVQLRRASSSRKPAGSVVVTRISKHWGNNPFRSAIAASQTGSRAVELYEQYLAENPQLVERIRTELAGRGLACLCPLDGQPCHANVLLGVANPKAPRVSPPPGC